MKAFKDRGFPSEKTFTQHFGIKSQLVSKVLEFCRKKDGYEDVVKFCEAYSPRTKSDKIQEVETTTVKKIGCVYLIKSARFYKIGKTNSIGRREYDIALQLAEKPTTVHVIKTYDPDGVEAYWHRRFAAKRKNGEWFDLNASDVKAFKKWLRIV